MNVFVILIGGNDVTGVYVHMSKCNQIVHFKWAGYFMSVLLNKAVNKHLGCFYTFKIWHDKQRVNNEIITENAVHPWVKRKPIPKYQDSTCASHRVQRWALWTDLVLIFFPLK